jgi:hypothetical protein
MISRWPLITYLRVLLLTIGICVLSDTRAIAAADCQTSPEKAFLARSGVVTMRPDYYSLQPLRAIQFGARQKHCYMLIEAFEGEADFRVTPRVFVGGALPTNIRLRLLKVYEHRSTALTDLAPEPNGVFHVKLPGGKIVADFYKGESFSSKASDNFILDRRIVRNSEGSNLTSKSAIIVAMPSHRLEPLGEMDGGPIVQIVVDQQSQVLISFKSTDGAVLCLRPSAQPNPTENLNLANDALNSMYISEDTGATALHDADTSTKIVVSYSDDQKQGRLVAVLNKGVYFLQLGPMLSCEHPPASLSVALTTTAEINPQVLAVEDWIASTPLGGRIEAVGIKRNQRSEDFVSSFGGEPPKGLHPTTHLILRANVYCDEPINYFEPIVEHAGRLAALLTDTRPENIFVKLSGGRKNIRMAFDPATNKAWFDPYKGGCAGAGEEPISAPVVEMFEAVSTVHRPTVGFPQMVRQFIKASFPEPVKANFDFPGSADGVSVRLDCLKGAIDQGKTYLLGGSVKYWQRLDLDFTLVGLAQPRLRVTLSGVYTEGGGEGLAHCPTRGQFAAQLDGKYDSAMNAFALELAKRFARFSVDAERKL